MITVGQRIAHVYRQAKAHRGVGARPRTSGSTGVGDAGPA